MCGIAGIFNYQNKHSIDLQVLQKMGGAIRHRGPDDEGFFIDPAVRLGLCHRRLSIIDLTTGKQPMSNAAETIWIVFNGEIYNFLELKRELQEQGYCFRTSSDTEVIISLYESYGIKGFERLNGIFAFGVYDKRNQCLVLARDHFGVKPLYYTFVQGSLIFGSEIKAILQYPSFKKELDYEAFHSFLTFRYNPSPQTLFKDIKKLYPGHYVKVTSEGSVELESYWNYQPATNTHISEEEAIEEYQRLLEQSIRRQLVSDVPVGLLLSGGIDSAVIGYLMQKNSKEKIKTFTIGFPGEGDFNELSDARVSARLIGTEHHELELTQKEYMDFFYKSFYYIEEPIAETSISALYYVSKLASDHVKVVLAGQGADEPMAGYHRYIGENYINKYAGLLRILPFQTIAAILPRNERFKRAVYVSKFSSEAQRFLGIYTIFTPEQKDQLLNDDVQGLMRNVDEMLVERLYSQTSQLKDSLSKITFIDTRMGLPDNLLLFNDKMTMANSLEMRVPFLDIGLIMFLESLPASFKLRGTTGKIIHKKAVEKWLPKEIIYRKKRGFETPMDTWLQSDLAQVAKNIINAKDSACSSYFSLPYINKMIDQHQNRKENFRRHIFALLSFELWCKGFFEGR
ncbi:MAG: asparagine synthase (glutamine-hydrolyzing) [Candidatus Jettenia caeni]|nr:MAG: asparagine synthase (glutamine-hydrolyzing) [Candidatus Jettenia caeni]